MTLKDSATFQVLFIVYLFHAWNITTVEIIVAFTYFKVISTKCLCLLLVVLVLLFWYDLGLGLKNLILFTSLLVVLSSFWTHVHQFSFCT